MDRAAELGVQVFLKQLDETPLSHHTRKLRMNHRSTCKTSEEKHEYFFCISGVVRTLLSKDIKAQHKRENSYVFIHIKNFH